MATVVQTKDGTFLLSPPVASGGVAFDSTPTSGNLLVAVMSFDKDSGAITVPSGFTEIFQYNSASVSGAAAYKVSAGTESGTITWTWANNADSSDDLCVWQVEVSGVQSAPEVSATANSGATAVSSQTSGTTASTTTANGLAIAAFGVDTGSNVINGQAVTNSFTITRSHSDSNASLCVATKTLSATGTVETTFSTTGPGTDQMWGAVFFLPDVVAATAKRLALLGVG